MNTELKPANENFLDLDKDENLRRLIRLARQGLAKGTEIRVTVKKEIKEP